MSSKEGSRWSVDDAESSDEQDQDRRAKRWVQPPLPRTEEMFGMFSDRKKFTTESFRPPLPLEKVKLTSESDDDDDEEEKNEKKDSKTESTQVSPDQVEGAPVETQDRVPDEVFETIIASSQNSELMDIPHVDVDKPQVELNSEENRAFADMVAEFEASLDAQSAGEQEPAPIPHVDVDKPQVPLSAEESKIFADMAAEFGAPQESQDLQKQDFPPIPSWEMPTVEHPLGEQEARSVESASTSLASSWRPPQVSPPFETARTAAADKTRSSSGFASGVNSALKGVGSLLEASAATSEAINNALPIVARTLTTVAVGGYLAGRKRERYSNEPLLQQQAQEINLLKQEQVQQRDSVARLENEQRKSNERVAVLAQSEKSQELGGEEQEIFDADGNKIVLQPGQRLERSAGGYSVVLNERNEVVHDAIRYGEAFRQEQKREQMDDSVFAALSAGSGAPDAGTQGQVEGINPLDTLLQAQKNTTIEHEYDYSQPIQQETVDLDHRLPAPKNHLSDALGNPWLWTGTAVLVIIYFIAQLA